jgi:hypothetical protein
VFKLEAKEIRRKQLREERKMKKRNLKKLMRLVFVFLRAMLSLSPDVMPVRMLQLRSYWKKMHRLANASSFDFRLPAKQRKVDSRHLLE